MVRTMAKEITANFKIDNSYESMNYICNYYNILNDMNNLATKGWFSGISFFEFYRKGGLHNILEFYNFLVDALSKIDEDT
jgi:hypothetical protein